MVETIAARAMGVCLAWTAKRGRGDRVARREIPERW